MQLEAGDLERHEFEVDQPATRGVRPRKVHQRKAWIGFDERPIALALSNGDLVMEGEVADVRAKRRALQPPRLFRAGSLSTGCMSGRRWRWKMERSATSSVMPCSTSRPLQPVRDPADATETIDITVRMSWRERILLMKKSA